LAAEALAGATGFADADLALLAKGFDGAVLTAGGLAADDLDVEDFAAGTLPTDTLAAFTFPAVGFPAVSFPAGGFPRRALVSVFFIMGDPF